MNAQSAAPVRRGPLYCIITAHPDDEAMFFVPTILSLIAQKEGATVWLLCLTTGDYDGLGSIRVKELQRCCRDVLDISKVIQVDDASIQDHPTQAWKIEAVAETLQSALEQAIRSEWPGTIFSSVHLITFDQGGVSGHINHRDTFFAVQHLFLEQEHKLLALLPTSSSTSTTAESNTLRSRRKIHSVWTLDTVYNPAAKYLPLLEWIRVVLYWSIVGRIVLVALDFLLTPSSAPLLKYDETMGKDETTSSSKATTIVFCCYRPWTVWTAMTTHASQFVWYRRLFVVFSCYTYRNRLRRLDSPLDQPSLSSDSQRGSRHVRQSSAPPTLNSPSCLDGSEHSGYEGAVAGERVKVRVHGD